MSLSTLTFISITVGVMLIITSLLIEFVVFLCSLMRGSTLLMSSSFVVLVKMIVVLVKMIVVVMKVFIYLFWTLSLILVRVTFVTILRVLATFSVMLIIVVLQPIILLSIAHLI